MQKRETRRWSSILLVCACSAVGDVPQQPQTGTGVTVSGNLTILNLTNRAEAWALSEQNAPEAWIIGAGSAMLVKLASSVDDVAWLSAFLTPGLPAQRKALHSAIYMTVCLTQTILAYGLAHGGKKLIEKFIDACGFEGVTAQQVLTIGAGLLLACFAVKLTYDYYNDAEDDKDTDGSASDDGPEVAALIDSAQTTEADVQAQTADSGCEGGANDKSACSLVVVAFLGSVDDLTLFVPMLAGHAFGLPQLALGAMAAGAMIVALCMFLTLCAPIARLLERIPLCAIVAVFAVVLLIKGFAGW